MKIIADNIYLYQFPSRIMHTVKNKARKTVCTIWGCVQSPDKIWFTNWHDEEWRIVTISITHDTECSIFTYSLSIVYFVRTKYVDIESRH